MRLTLCVCGDQQAVILGTVTDGIRRHDVTHARFDYSCKGNRPSSVSHTAERGWGHTSAILRQDDQGPGERAKPSQGPCQGIC